MDPLTNLLAVMALSGSIFFFIPDGPARSSFAEGEIFPSSAGSFYDRGWTTGYYDSSHSQFGDGDMVSMNIAKGFSLQRFYLSSTQLMEFGGYGGVYNQFLRQPEELLLLNTDYLGGMNFSYLNGGFVTKVIWGYERHQAQTDYLDDLPEESKENTRLVGDSLELLVGDVRQTFRYYLAYGKFQHFTPSARKGFSRFGFDYRSGAASSVHLILAAEQRSYAYNNWAVTNTVRLGLEKSQSPLDGWRILWEWTKGKSDYGPYYQADAEISGISFQRVF